MEQMVTKMEQGKKIVTVKPTNSGTESLGSVSGLDSSRRDLNSDYKGLGNLNNHQNNPAALDGNEWNGDCNGMGAGNRQESGDDRGDDGNNHVDDGHGN